MKRAGNRCCEDSSRAGLRQKREVRAYVGGEGGGVVQVLTVMKVTNQVVYGGGTAGGVLVMLEVVHVTGKRGGGRTQDAAACGKVGDKDANESDHQRACVNRPQPETRKKSVTQALTQKRACPVVGADLPRFRHGDSAA
jgi:hypothetical protein